MKILLSLIFCSLLFSVRLDAQVNNNPNYEFLPEGLHYIALKADYHEPRIGILYYPDNGNLKVDLGNSIDLFSYFFSSYHSKISIGIDFYAYALSTSYSGKRLQIDALDGFFGGNLSYSSISGQNRVLGRLRIIHNSAHLVDGHYDNNEEKWIGGKSPLAYARDFVELNLGHEINFQGNILKYSGGTSFSFLVRPEELKRFSFNSGIEFSNNTLIPKIFNHHSYAFISYYFYLSGVPEYSGSHNVMLGVKFGDWNYKGIVIYLSYFAGNNVFSEYYYEKIKKFGIGFYVDFI